MLEAALVVVWLVFVLQATVIHIGGPVGSLLSNGTYYVVIIAAAVGCLLRGLVQSYHRGPWLAIGIGLLAWVVGDVYYLLRLQELAVTPVPSLADLFYLAYFPFVYVGVTGLMRGKIAGATRALWLDGLTVALTVAAVACALLFPAMESATGGAMAATATNLAYPLGDIVLLALLAGLAMSTNFRLDTASLLLGVGLIAATVADGLYLVQSANGTYVEGGLTDACWAASLLLIGGAAWRDKETVTAAPQWRPIVTLPLLSALIATTILFASSWISIGALASALAVAAIGVVVVRLAFTLRENSYLLASARDAARVDALTGLPNRRALMDDLGDLACNATEESPLAVALFDLNGFKQYNDRFGHAAGDMLLRRLGERLRVSASSAVRVYRLGGDEFCLLAFGTSPSAVHHIEQAMHALAEKSSAYTVSASFGVAFIPGDATAPSEALRSADIRLYRRKAGHYANHERPCDELVRVLDCRRPELAPTRRLAATFSHALAEAVGLDEDEQTLISRAALLRDVGLLALPDEIAYPTRKLTDAETALLDEQPRIAERILESNPALSALAPIVAASFKPRNETGADNDAAAGNVALAGKIVAASAAAAQALNTATVDAALHELKRLAPHQLDPTLMAQLEALIKSKAAETRSESRQPATTV